MVYNINKMSLEGYPVEGYARILGSEHERLDYIVFFFCFFFMCIQNLGATHTETVKSYILYSGILSLFDNTATKKFNCTGH